MRFHRGDRDPFAVLGLTSSASAAEVRVARRTLAAAAHPDVGGDAGSMQQINAAADAALQLIATRDAAAGGPSGADTRAGADPRTGTGTATGRPDAHGGASSGGWQAPSFSYHDVPSFVMDVLPVEAFEGLLLAAAELGEVVDDDPPYELVVLAHDPGPCWVVLSVVPDAGASTVSLHLGRVEPEQAELLGHTRSATSPPAIERVRDRWIEVLNTLDW